MNDAIFQQTKPRRLFKQSTSLDHHNFLKKGAQWFLHNILHQKM
jgi:hypothetical protein